MIYKYFMYLFKYVSTSAKHCWEEAERLVSSGDLSFCSTHAPVCLLLPFLSLYPSILPLPTLVSSWGRYSRLGPLQQPAGSLSALFSNDSLGESVIRT